MQILAVAMLLGHTVSIENFNLKELRNELESVESSGVRSVDMLLVEVDATIRQLDIYKITQFEGITSEQAYAMDEKLFNIK